MLKGMYDNQASHPVDAADQTMFVHESRPSEASNALDAFTDTDDEGVRSDSHPTQTFQARTPSARLYQSRSSATASPSYFVIVIPPAGRSAGGITITKYDGLAVAEDLD